MPLIARTRRNPAGRRRAKIGEDREDLVVIVRIRRSQADDRTGIDQAVEGRSVDRGRRPDDRQSQVRFRDTPSASVALLIT